MKRFFEFVSASASKFWNISTNKLEIETHYGRIGTPGRTTTFPADTKDELNKIVEKKINEKLKKGYVEVGKKTPVKKTPVKKTPVKKTPVKKTPVKKTPVKKTSTKKKIIIKKPKTSAKKTPAKKKIVIKKKKDNYDEEWATTPDNYTSGVPTKAKLGKRKQMIDEIYKMYKEVKKLDEDSYAAVNPEEWRVPPEYCGEDELKGMVLLLKEELTNLTKPKTPVKKTPVKKTPVKKTPAKKTPVKKPSTKKKIVIKKVATPKIKVGNDCLASGYKAMWDVKKQGVMLAHTFKDPKTGKIKNPPKGTSKAPDGWYLSEKYDGYRAIWNGKDFVSRAGNIFATPEWFRMWMPPSIVLDGELFLGRECFEDCGLFRRKTPNDEEWLKSNVKYQVFDCPGHPGLFEERQKYIKDLIQKRCQCNVTAGTIKTSCPMVLTKQIKVKNEDDVMKRFNALVKKGAEGVMLRAPNSPYEAKRTSYLLKVKQLFDAECRIIGYKPGTGKYKNMLGAFKCELIKDTKIKFDISGMDDETRKNYMKTHKVGTIVTFTYMGLSNSGIPRHPVYQRIRKGNI